MPDLLAHALVAYSLATLLSWRYEWLSPAYVTVAMAGAFVPDLTKVSLLVPSPDVQAVLGVPFHWFAIHTLGGSAVLVTVGVVLSTSPERRRVGALLALGATSHLLADAFLVTLPGRVFPGLWPLSSADIALPELYVSTDPRPMLVAAAVAVCVTLVSRARRRRAE